MIVSVRLLGRLRGFSLVARGAAMRQLSVGGLVRRPGRRELPSLSGCLPGCYPTWDDSCRCAWDECGSLPRDGWRGHGVLSSARESPSPSTRRCRQRARDPRGRVPVDPRRRSGRWRSAAWSPVRCAPLSEASGFRTRPPDRVSHPHTAGKTTVDAHSQPSMHATRGRDDAAIPQVVGRGDRCVRRSDASGLSVIARWATGRAVRC